MLNSCILMGRITQTPELKTTKNGNSVVSFCLASSRPRAGPDGKTEADFIDCVAWNKTAEFIAQYFKKGEPIIVEGRIETRGYEDKQGIKRKASEVIVRAVDFCVSKKDKDEQSDGKTVNVQEDDLLEDTDLPF